MFVSLLTQYLDVEEIFHLHDSESAAKVILLKRTEVDAQQLAVLARSHHALSQKNELIIKVLGCIRQTPGWYENKVEHILIFIFQVSCQFIYQFINQFIF